MLSIFDPSTISNSDGFLPDHHLNIFNLSLTHRCIDVTSDIENLPILNMSHIRLQDHLAHPTGTAAVAAHRLAR